MPIPYSITGGLCVLIAVGHLLFYIRALKIERDKFEVRQVMKNHRKVIKLSLIFRLTMLLLIQIRKM